MSGNEIIDLTSDNEPIERPRRITDQQTLTRQFRPMENNAETSHKSGQTDEIMITETKIVPVQMYRLSRKIHKN